MRGLVALAALAAAAANGPLAPLCDDAEKCGAARGARKPDEATEPLSKTGAWGFSYGPNPLMKQGTFPNDDVMAHWMRGQWAWDGRDDMGVMASMGSKVVRLYGNDPRYSAQDFLGEANTWGIKVIAGISDWPYTQAPDHCAGDKGGNDCFKNLKEHYTAMLETGGFLLGEDGKDLRYHPALDTVIIINEPELKIRDGDRKLPQDYMKVVLSAFDGMLAAEEARGLDVLSDSSPKFTATWSYGLCESCPNALKLKDLLGCCFPCPSGQEDQCKEWGPQGQPADKGGMICPDVRKPNEEDNCPALAPIMDLYTAMEDPSTVGYKFTTKKWQEAYEKRWVHSLNAFVRAEVLERQFFKKYVKMPFNTGKKAQEMVPVFMGEYGDPHEARDPVGMQKDLEAMVKMVKGDEYPLFAVNVFQFQVAYWKPCPEEGEKEWQQWTEKNWAHPMNAPFPQECTERQYGTFALGDIPMSLTGPVDESGKEFPIPCIKPIFKGKPEAIAAAFGGKVPDTSVCKTGWQAKPKKFCVAARGNLDRVGDTMEWVCKKMFEDDETDCKQAIPPVCEDSKEGIADWVFSNYYAHTKEDSSCRIDNGMVLTALPQRRECVADAGKPAPKPKVTITTTSTTTVNPEVGGFFAKNKWWIIGGGIVAAGVGVGVGLACSRQGGGSARAPSTRAPQGVEMS